MDLEKTAPFELGSGDPCLIVHGFTGSPWDMRPLGDALAARGYHVRCPRLPGHGTTPEAMGGVRHQDWTESVEESLLSFGHQHRIFVAGFSMGGLLSLLLAARFPSRIRGLVLMAPAMDLQGRALRVVRRLRHIPALDRLRPYIFKDGTDIEDEATRTSAPLLEAFPSARLKDLFVLQDKTRRVLSQVRAPTLVVMSQNDHVVELEGGRQIVRGLTQAHPLRYVLLRRGFHIQPRDLDAPLLFDEIGSFFQSVKEREGWPHPSLNTG